MCTDLFCRICYKPFAKCEGPIYSERVCGRLFCGECLAEYLARQTEHNCPNCGVTHASFSELQRVSEQKAENLDFDVTLQAAYKEFNYIFLFLKNLTHSDAAAVRECNKYYSNAELVHRKLNSATAIAIK